MDHGQPPSRPGLITRGGSGLDATLRASCAMSLASLLVIVSRMWRRWRVTAGVRLQSQGSCVGWEQRKGPFPISHEPNKRGGWLTFFSHQVSSPPACPVSAASELAVDFAFFTTGMAWNETRWEIHNFFQEPSILWPIEMDKSGSPCIVKSQIWRRCRSYLADAPQSAIISNQSPRDTLSAPCSGLSPSNSQFY